MEGKQEKAPRPEAAITQTKVGVIDEALEGVSKRIKRSVTGLLDDLLTVNPDKEGPPPPHQARSLPELLNELPDNLRELAMYVEEKVDQIRDLLI